MNRVALLLACGALLSLCASCASTPAGPSPAAMGAGPAPKGLVILQPDPDGRTGELVVANRGGSQVLNQPGQATEIADAAAPPSVPAFAADGLVATAFGPALAALPEPPRRYVLHFQSASTTLTADSQRLLGEILASVKARQATELSIVGHSDRKGSRQLNYRLALNRALAVKALLISKGVDPSIIEAESHGEDNPLIKTEDEVAEPRNRRVEVTVR